MKEKIFGITRVRNEAQIIADTIEHFLGYVGRIVLFDDYSTDETVDIAAAVGGDRITIIRGTEWRPNRVAEETRHRALVMEKAKQLGAEWALCFDADERLVGRLPSVVGSESGFRFRLFDGYMTEDFRAPFQDGVLDARLRKWGPEFRDILMLFRIADAEFRGLDQRSPYLAGRMANVPVFVKHFGKCISVEQWEETCRYYAGHFPRRYREKWLDRMGKAIHSKSDFGRDLYSWDELMERGAAWRRI
jgi:glycosyltransferase involved in cell wall biosynthesis